MERKWQWVADFVIEKENLKNITKSAIFTQSNNNNITKGQMPHSVNKSLQLVCVLKSTDSKVKLNTEYFLPVKQHYGKVNQQSLTPKVLLISKSNYQ